jgi:septation ring formation regulator EzrA
MKAVKKFDEFINESVTIGGMMSKTTEKTLNSIEDYKSKIYNLFYEVYDEDSENENRIPKLKTLYKKLAPVITEGDDVGEHLDGWVNKEIKNIEAQLKEVYDILQEGKALVDKK